MITPNMSLYHLSWKTLAVIIRKQLTPNAFAFDPGTKSPNPMVDRVMKLK